MGIHVSKKGNDMQRFRREKISSAGHTRPRSRRLAGLLAVSLGLLTALVAGPTGPVPSVSAQAPEGQGFTLNKSDLNFILAQMRIAEHHAISDRSANLCNGLLGPDPVTQIPDNGVGVTLSLGLRTVDGTCNNLIRDESVGVDQSKFGASDQFFPRLVPAQFKSTPNYTPAPPGGPVVTDPAPRQISNLIVDQTETNPAAVEAAGPNPEITESGSFFIPNVAPDVGLSAPYNSWFTLFGQFFDHGLDLVNKGGTNGNAGIVFIPLLPGDPLYIEDSPTNFMVLTRASHVGPEATNQTTPFVDQSQTYTSHPSHQVFLRDYDANGSGQPIQTGRLITGPGDGMGTWADVKAQASDVLGIELTDMDALSIPLLATDPYGHFLPGPNGFPQLVTPGGLVEGSVTDTPDGPVGITIPADAARTGHAFLDDIAHNAAPSATKSPDANDVIDPHGVNDPPLPNNVYDDELLAVHFIAGDGRVNENIGLTAVHHIFHSEHNRLRDEIDGMLHDPALFSAEELAAWTEVSPARAGWSYEERLFQAARFVTEMEYQHLAFEEFIRKVQPMVGLFGEAGTGYHTEINPAIRAEFAHAVYRFGHSMLFETVDRTDPLGNTSNIDLLDAFLNPPALFDNTDGPLPAGITAAERGVGNIVRGMTRQVGNELDEFVTDAVRNNLLGLPLDLATLNMARARDTGIPGLNAARRAFFAESQNPALVPYASWADLGFRLRHRESLVNFIAAYGTLPSLVAARANTTDERAIAQTLIDTADEGADPGSPEREAYDFLNSLGAFASTPEGITTTGVDDIDLWVGGLAEEQQAFGGLLGATFNYVFENQMEDLQNGDRFYYLARTAGMNLLTQLEGNSFAELIARNTDVQGLPADSFSRPDVILNVPNLGTSGAIPDDPTTPDVDESTVEELFRTPGGGFRYDGPLHVVFNGRDLDTQPPSAVDSIFSSEGDDTLRGNGGNDKLEGGNGVDNIIGGLGNDILTDLGVLDDTLKGGGGNDVLSSGQGNGGDLPMGGLGDDFIIGGNDVTESFGGPGNDTIFAGDDEDTVFGDDGDDWEDGGKGPFNFLNGDNGAPFADDINAPGNDVAMSCGGEQDYDGEGGDEVLFMCGGIQRAEGHMGFDWAVHRGDPLPANTDMSFTVAEAGVPAVNNNRDRMDRVEGLSGWNFSDILRGDDRATLGVVDAERDLTGHELDAEGIARLNGLAALLPVGATSFTGGNIILGGAGSDLIEGRGGNDIMDGDRWLDAQLRAPNLATTDPADTALFDSLAPLRLDAVNGRLDPGAISIVRTVKTPSQAQIDASTDVALFSDVEANYDINQNADGSITVVHARPDPAVADDGTDTLWNIEIARFPDTDGAGPLVGSDVNFGVVFNRPASGTVTISGSSPPVEGQPLTVSAVVNDPDGPASPVLTFEWQREIDGDWQSTGVFGTSFTPSDAGVGHQLRVVVTFLDRFGVPEQVVSDPTQPVQNVNDAPVGTPVILGALTNPLVGLPLSVDLSELTDEDGLGTPSFQWQRNGVNINGATNATFTPLLAHAGGTLRVRVTYTDQHGTVEQVFSAATGAVEAPPIAIAELSATSMNFGTRNRNTAPTTKSVTVTNFGNASLQVTNRTRTGTGAASYSQPTGCPDPVPPGESCQVSISFLTTATVGTKTATLNIFTNAGTKTVGLTGTLSANQATSGVPAIDDGTPTKGQKLTASTSGIVDLDGTSTTAFTYQWQQSSVGGATPYVAIPTATSSEFTPGDGQVNRRLRVVVSGVDDRGSTLGNRTSAATTVVADAFVGTAGADTWLGSAVADTASGGDGNDTMTALAGNDTVSGDGGDDTIDAGTGNDTVSGGAGTDAITPGTGLDVVVFAPGDGAATVVGFDHNVTGGQDLMNISALGITAGNFGTVIRTDLGADVRVTIGTVTIVLTGVANIGLITAADFVLAP